MPMQMGFLARGFPGQLVHAREQNHLAVAHPLGGPGKLVKRQERRRRIKSGGRPCVPGAELSGVF